MYKGYINVSRNLIQNYESLGLNSDDVMFLLKVLSFKYKQAISDEMIGFNRTKCFRIRKKLKELNILSCYSQKNIGTIYHLNLKVLKGLIGDNVERAKEVEVEKVEAATTYQGNLVFFTEEQIELILKETERFNLPVEQLSSFSLEVLNNILDKAV